MIPEDSFQTESCCSCCCEPTIDAAPVIDDLIVPEPAPVVEEPAPVVEAPAPVIEEPAPTVPAPTPPEPNFDVTQTAPAPEPTAGPVAQPLAPSVAVIGGPEPDELAGLRQTIESGSAVIGGPAPTEFSDLGRTLADSTVVGGPVPSEFTGLGQFQYNPALDDRGWASQWDEFLRPNPNRTVDPNAALFAPQAWHQWGDAMGQLHAASLNSALLGPANHTAQYSSSLGVDWVENGRYHV
jgi:hypothetical protein